MKPRAPRTWADAIHEARLIHDPEAELLEHRHSLVDAP